MIGRVRHILLTLVALLAFTVESQAGLAEKIRLEGIARVSHVSSSGMNLWLEVTNDTGFRFVARRAELDIMIDGRHVATITLRDKVVVPRRRSSEILIPLRFKSHSSFALVRLLRRIVTGDSDDITVNYRLRAGISVYKKNFKAENVAVSRFLDKFAIRKEHINELIDKM